jgi:hypothetical protein
MRSLGSSFGAVALAGLVLAAGLLGVAPPLRAQAPADPPAPAWAVACSAERGCRASLPSTTGKEVLLVAWLPGASGLSLGFATPFAIADRERPVNLRIDGRVVATLRPARDYAPLERQESFWIVDEALVDRLVKAISAPAAAALRVEFLDVTGTPHDADFPLGGLAATLERFEAGGAEGKVRAGASARALPAPPPATKAELILKQGLPPRLIERHRAASDCEDLASPLLKPIAPSVGVLSPTAIVYGLPCTMSGGETAYRLWLVESGEIGGITPLYFAVYDATFGWRGTDLLTDVAFEPASGRMTGQAGSLRNGAGCGLGTWRWKDYAFALEQYAVWRNCASRGSAPQKVYPTR